MKTTNLIDKIIKFYHYGDKIDFDAANIKYYERYLYWCEMYKKKKNKANYDYFWGALIASGTSLSHHEVAKRLLFQGELDCWKYFERTALFWSFADGNEQYIDATTAAYGFSLFVERKDLIEKLFEKSMITLLNTNYKNNLEYKNQLVYPSSFFIHFLIERWIGYNPILPFIANYGKGAGVYQRIMDHWDAIDNIDNDYWNELCEYHLQNLGLREDRRDNEEYLWSGLIPIELLCMLRIRRQLGLKVPCFNHSLFATPMAKEPRIPTGYNEEFDVKFQLVKHTIETKQTYTYNDIIAIIKNRHGNNIELFM